MVGNQSAISNHPPSDADSKSTQFSSTRQMGAHDFLASFYGVFMAHSLKLCKYSKETAEDLLQETACKVLCSATGLKTEEEWRKYILAALINNSIEDVAKIMGTEVGYTKYRFGLLKKKIRIRVKARALEMKLENCISLVGRLVNFHSSHIASGLYGTPELWGLGDQSAIAHLVDLFGYEFLAETLELSDEMFEEIYGERISIQRRREVLKVIKIHWASCSHCQHLDAEHEKEDAMVESWITGGRPETLLLNPWNESKAKLNHEV